MANDYHRPRRSSVADEPDDDSADLGVAPARPQTGVLDADENDLADSVELPGGDLSDLSPDELTMPIIPPQHDEFVCSRCHLVQHRRRIADQQAGQYICRDCL